jgi:hypothetical protein
LPGLHPDAVEERRFKFHDRTLCRGRLAQFKT